MLSIIDRAFTDHNICLFLQDRTHQFFDVISAVLVIGISIDNDIRTVSQAGIQPCHEPLCQSAVRPEIDYIVHAPVFRNLDGIVTASVVDDQILDLIDPVDMFWQMIQCNFQRLCLVITWHLYN